MTPKEFKKQMLMAERIAFTDSDAAINFANSLMAQLLVDKGYTDGVLVYKRIIDSEIKK